MKQPLSLICAFARNHVIGRGNDLPWDIPKDLEHFRETTRGKPVILGRLTYESILGRRNGKPLPGRPHYVVSRQNFSSLPEGVTSYTDLDSAIAAAKKDFPDTEVFIIGGAKIYQQSIPLVDRMYLTIIEKDIPDGDAFFPNYNEQDWVETHREDFANEPTPFRFITLERR